MYHSTGGYLDTLTSIKGCKFEGIKPYQYDHKTRSNLMKKHFIVVGLLSVSLLTLELTWTRIFSAEFFYTFAFLILSLAVLGLGLGALFLHMVPELKSEKYLGIILSFSGLMALVGPPAVFYIGLDFSSIDA